MRMQGVLPIVSTTLSNSLPCPCVVRIASGPAICSAPSLVMRILAAPHGSTCSRRGRSARQSAVSAADTDIALEQIGIGSEFRSLDRLLHPPILDEADAIGQRVHRRDPLLDKEDCDPCLSKRGDDLANARDHRGLEPLARLVHQKNAGLEAERTRN